jgi:signal transduction histidine kinase
MVVVTWDRWRNWPGWWTPVRNIALLVAIGVSVAAAASRSPAGTVLGLAGVAVGWLMWSIPGAGPVRATAGLFLAGGAGVLLCYTNPASAALAYPAIVCVRAGAYTAPRRSIGLTVLLAGAFDAGVLAADVPEHWLVLGPLIFFASLAAGLIRRQYLGLQADAEAARAEQSALAERARIAREIHDVLAHALAALTVQLETADALLEGGRSAQARELVIRAGQLAREGLAETRRAIGALRGEALPLPELLRALAAGYRADLAAPATVTVDGAPRDLDADTGLALYRAAQEAITNVRKHAPGAPVEVGLAYRDGGVDLTVVNGPPPGNGHRALATTGGGYGLTGLRERAELARGEFDAGPQGDGWRVGVRIPT